MDTGVPVASGALGGGELGSTGAVNPPPFLLVSTKIRQVKSDTRSAPLPLCPLNLVEMSADAC